MANRKAELLDEISQLLEQYQREVPGRGRPWPESLKARIHELRGLGVNCRRIAEQTNIPYFTVARWVREKKAPSFELVRVVDTPNEAAGRATASATVTSPTKKVATAAAATRRTRVAAVTGATFDSTQTVTVALPSGVRIEGADLNFLLGLLPRLGVVLL